jgi:hypothetical protein
MDLLGDFSHKYITTDPITGEPIEVGDCIDNWVQHEIAHNNLWDRWVIVGARQYLQHCFGLNND